MSELAQAARLRLGLPAWAFPAWRGRYFARDVPALTGYARAFETVEANTTFYTLPDETTVARWREQLQGGELRLCFKLPREITHGTRLGAAAALAPLFDRLAPLAPWFGPFMVQLPPRLGPARYDELALLLSTLPREYRFAVEVRHPDWFTAPQRLFELLERTDCGRVILDSRPIYGDAPAHPDLVAAAHEKPPLPVLWEGPETLRIVRFVAHPLAAHNLPYGLEWAAALTSWLRPGNEVHFIVHCPNDAHCPPLARALHGPLAAAARTAGAQGPAALPAWPLEQLGFSFD